MVNLTNILDGRGENCSVGGQCFEMPVNLTSYWGLFHHYITDQKLKIWTSRVLKLFQEFLFCWFCLHIPVVLPVSDLTRRLGHMFLAWLSRLKVVLNECTGFECTCPPKLSHIQYHRIPYALFEFSLSPWLIQTNRLCDCQVKSCSVSCRGSWSVILHATHIKRNRTPGVKSGTTGFCVPLKRCYWLCRWRNRGAIRSVRIFWLIWRQGVHSRCCCGWVN